MHQYQIQVKFYNTTQYNTRTFPYQKVFFILNQRDQVSISVSFIALFRNVLSVAFYGHRIYQQITPKLKVKKPLSKN